MKGFLLLFAGIWVILLSCSSGQEKKSKIVHIRQNAFLFNMQHIFTESENNLSFPVWFNDSIIRKMKISQLIRSHYRISDDEEEQEDLKETRRYSFDKNGCVTRLEVEQFYDDQRIGHVVYEYKDPKDEFGFSEPVQKTRKESDDDESVYQIYTKELYTQKFLVYVNEERGNYRFYLMNKKNWGTVSVDTIANPTPEDIVVYGTPEHPEKVFQIRNTVNEFNVTEFTYNPKFGFAERIFFENYPFQNKRTLKYQTNGNFDSFIDSTFSGDQFLNRSVSRMRFDKNKLPESLRRDYFMEGETGGYSEIERYTYEYYGN